MSKPKTKVVDYKRLYEDQKRQIEHEKRLKEEEIREERRLKEEEIRLKEEEIREERRLKEEERRLKEEERRLKEEERRLREHAEQVAKVVSIRSVLNEKPQLLAELATPSFEYPDLTSVTPKKRKSGYHDTTLLVPPEYIPAVTWENEPGSESPDKPRSRKSKRSAVAPSKLSAAASAESLSKSEAAAVAPAKSSLKTAAAKSLSKNAAAKLAYEQAKAGLPPGWQPVMSPTDKTQVAYYKHILTGLLHNLRPTGKGIPLLKRWEIEDFRSHLVQAEDAKIQSVPIWPLLMKWKVSEDKANQLRGHYKTSLKRLENEGSLEIRAQKTVYKVIEDVIKESLANVDFDGWQVGCDTGPISQDPMNCPGNSSRRRVDGLFEVFLEKVGDFTRSIACIISETKQVRKFPCLKSECLGNDKQHRNDLIKFYLDTKTGTTTDIVEHNVLVQIRTYLSTYHRHFGIITTLNTWTFVRLDMDGILSVSPTFEADKQPEGMDWCLLEVLFRFIFAAIGEYRIGERPNDMMPSRPDFVKRYYNQNPDLKDKDAKWGWNWNQGSSGGNQAGSSSSSSSSAAQGRKAAGTNQNQVVGPVCWADMEDPRRNADESDLTWQESFSKLGALEGDAHPIGEGRSGVVYRKKFGDWDLAIKTYYLYQQHDSDEPTDDEIKSELNKEAEFYLKNADIQGEVIPRFFGLRTLQIAECLITEYIGPSYDTFEKITKEQMRSALAALSTLHRRGILHGDVALRNILWSEKLKRAFWIDFAFSSPRREECSDADWAYLTREEFNKIKIALNSRVGTSPKDPSEKKLKRKSLT